MAGKVSRGATATSSENGRTYADCIRASETATIAYAVM